MTITLLPHQERAITAAISAGVIHSVEEFLDSAIAHLPEQPDSTNARPSRSDAADMVELFAPLRGLNIDFERDRDPGRDLVL